MSDPLERLKRDLLHTPQLRAEAGLSYQGLQNLVSTQRVEVERERDRLELERTERQRRFEDETAAQEASLAEQAMELSRQEAAQEAARRSVIDERAAVLLQEQQVRDMLARQQREAQQVATDREAASRLQAQARARADAAASEERRVQALQAQARARADAAASEERRVQALQSDLDRRRQELTAEQQRVRQQVRWEAAERQRASERLHGDEQRLARRTQELEEQQRNLAAEMTRTASEKDQLRKLQAATDAAAKAVAHARSAADKKLASAVQKMAVVKHAGTILYHQTSPQIAQLILSTQQMKPGSQGLAGGGIYFATTKELTGHKALQKGVILEARVQLGRILTLESHGDPSMSLAKLKGKGFDSTCIARPVQSGHEYVVYDPAQVLEIRKAH